jgi:anaerobic magnesium-protoporphyrin IX monomethyl ester cyclase
MRTITFIVPPHLQFKDFISPSERVKVVPKKDGKFYGNLITDMPLGPLAMSAYIKEHVPGINTKLLDFNVELNQLDGFDYESFEAYFDNFFGHTNEYDDTQIFGLSCLFSPSYLAMIDIARAIKKRYPRAIVMAGGNIPSNMYKDIYKLAPESFDLICYGEGELPLIKYLRSEQPSEYVKTSGSWITPQKALDQNFVPTHDFIWELDQIPLYDYDLCEDKYSVNPAYTAYGGHQDKESNVHILTSRGCPFHCIFCASHKVHGRKMRYYSIDRVKKDLLFLKEKYDVKTLLFQDDHFMGDPARALEIVKYVGDLGIKFIFQNSLALYALKREFLEACKRAGMNQLVLSVESGSDRVLKKVMKKPLNLKIIDQVVKDCRELGIYTYCNIVMGLPGETKEDIEETRAFLKTTYANWFGIFIANPLVGSEMFEICSDKNYLEENWIGSDYKQAVVSTEHWSAQFIERKTYQLNLELNFLWNSDYRLGLYAEALTAFERVLGAKKDHAIALLMAARCHKKLGDTAKAESYLAMTKDLYENNLFWRSHMDDLGVDAYTLEMPEKETALAVGELEPGSGNKHFTQY